MAGGLIRVLVVCLSLSACALAAEPAITKAAAQVTDSKTVTVTVTVDGTKVTTAKGSVNANAVASKSVGRAVSNAAVSPQAAVQSIIKFSAKTQPGLSKIFQTSKAPGFLVNNLKTKLYKFTLFFPTDKALAHYKVDAGCPKVPFSDIFAQLMVPVLYSFDALKKLKRGAKLRTMSPVYITKLDPTKDGKLRIGVVTGYNKIVSVATIVQPDALINTRSFALHYVDSVLTTCTTI